LFVRVNVTHDNDIEPKHLRQLLRFRLSQAVTGPTASQSSS